MEPLLPNPKKHACSRQALFRVSSPSCSESAADERDLLIPRTGARWNSLDAAGIRSCSSGVPSIQWNDDQSSPCELEKTGPNPTDRGKQGVKPSLLTEAKGIPLSVVVDGANRHDMGRKRGRYGRRPDFVHAGGWLNALRSWMNRFRRILVRWEKLVGTYPAMLHLACCVITWRTLGLSK